MAQFPFAHTIEMTHRLSGGVLEVRTTIQNHSADPMPLVIGFHPWYQIPRRSARRMACPIAGSPTLPALPETHSNRRNRTGYFSRFHLARRPSVRRRIRRRGSERRVLGSKLPARKLSVRFGPKFPIAIVYAPQTRDIVCFEPMTGLTDGFNLAHEGDLQSPAKCSAG